MMPTPRTHDAAQSIIPRRSSTQPLFYVPIPQRLVTLLYDTPLAIGIYTLVARLHQATKAPVPLSAPDLLRYDPSISRGAALRALDRLTSSGYLLAQGAGRQKRSYMPAWGRVRDAPLAWDLTAPCLGRPRHIQALRLDQRLLDTCMGKLTPHPARAAIITRYLTTPLLSIADIGVYALALMGIPRTTTALARLGLISDGEPQPLMSEARLLALASQQTLSSEPGAALTASGARKLGIAPLLSPNVDTALPLFFVPPALIGSLIEPLIEPLIGQDAELDRARTTPQCGEVGLPALGKGITWINMNTMESRNPPPTPPHTRDGGGGQLSSVAALDPGRPAGRPAVRSASQRLLPRIPETEAAQLLRAINVRPEVIVELANTPIATIQQAVADAQARPYVRDVAAWAVALLRAHRDHGFTIAPPAPPANSAQALQRYFADQAAQQEAERAAAHVLDTPPAPHTTQADPPRDQAMGAALEMPYQASDTLQSSQDDLTTVIRHELRWRLGRELRPLANKLEIRILDDAVQLVCRCSADILTVQTQILPLVRVILGEHDDTSIQRVTMAAAGPVPAAPSSISASPPWIAPARWAALSSMLRTLLCGSTVVDGQLCAASKTLMALLQTRYAAETAALLEEYRIYAGAG